MNQYSTKQLLALLVALLEVLIVAKLFKQYSVQVVCQKYPTLIQSWTLYYGICVNVERTFSRYDDPSLLLNELFQNCQSGTGSRLLPVPSANGVTYETRDPEQMWGDHPYADNRRKIIQECIDQLHTELQRRNINVG